MCLPAISLIQSLGIRISLCGRPWAKDLFAGMGFESFIPVTGKLVHDLKILRGWHRHHPDYQQALLMPDSLSSALLFKLAGFDSAGYKDDGRSLLLSLAFNKPQPRPHALRSWFSLTEQALQSWGFALAPQLISESLSLPVTEEHQQLARQALEKAGLAPKEFVLIAPTAVGQHKGQIKVWPYFENLTEHLQKAGLRVAMCPPAAEQAAALLAAPSAECLPALSLGAFAALTREASLVICNDSGVSHICAAAGAYQLTLFGVTDPEMTGPWTPNSLNLGQNGQWPSPELVIQHLRQLLRLSN